MVEIVVNVMVLRGMVNKTANKISRNYVFIRD